MAERPVARFLEHLGRAALSNVIAGAALSCLMPTGAATARIQDYQIERLLSYKTQCQAKRLEDRSPRTGPMRFFVECENKTFYPDGVEISCADRDDDRSCVLLTKEKAFDQLHLLDRNK